MEGMTDGYLRRIGTLVREARVRRGFTTQDLAERVGMTGTDIEQIEAGDHDLSLDVLAALGKELEAEFVSMGHSGPQHLRIEGGRRLAGSIEVRTSKNAAVATLCASLLNRGRTTLRRVARIE